MGFFGSSGRISREEFRRALFKLRSKGFSNQEIDEIENIFYSALHEHGESAGISAEEFKRGLQYLLKHPGNHHLSSEEIKKLEEVLSHYL